MDSKIDELKAVFSYCETTGEIRRNDLPSRPNCLATVLESPHRMRMAVNYKKKSILAHRLAWLYVFGEWPSEDIDHINQNTLDNSIDNLRLSVDKLNHRNRTKYRNNKSGIPGVSFYTRLQKWQAEGQQIIDGKRVRHYLGVFTSFLDACAVRKSWELRYGYSENHGKESLKVET